LLFKASCFKNKNFNLGKTAISKTSVTI